MKIGTSPREPFWLFGTSPRDQSGPRIIMWDISILTVSYRCSVQWWRSDTPDISILLNIMLGPTVENIPDIYIQHSIQHNRATRGCPPTPHHAGLFYLSVTECDIVRLCVARQQCDMLCLQQRPGHTCWRLSAVSQDPVLSGGGVVLQTVERPGGQSHR